MGTGEIIDTFITTLQYLLEVTVTELEHEV